jgi:antitoxin component of MazEF toxin-antitoxin module
MITKVIKIGNSFGFIIPKKMLDSLGWKVGDKVNVYQNYEDGTVIYTKKWLKKNSKKF